MAFLQYDISVVGIEKVRAALRTVEQELLRSNARAVRGAGAGARTPRPSGATPQTDAVDVARRTHAVANASRREDVASHDRAERAKTAATERELRKRQTAELALNKQRSAALYRRYQADERAKTAASRIAEHDRRQGRAELVRATRGVLGGTIAKTAAVGRAGLAMTGLAGGALFATAARGAMRREAVAANLANQLVGNEATKETITAKREDILSVASGTKGFETSDVVGAMSAFQGLAGEEAATMKAAPLITKTALATGADLNEVAEMMANVFNGLRNAAGGGAKTVDELLKMSDDMSLAFAAMGSIGAVELKDLARVGGDIAASGLRFQGKSSVDSIKSAAAAVQLARGPGGSKSSEEAATSLRAFAQDLTVHSETIQKSQAAGGLGMNIWADKGKTKLRALPDLVSELFEKTGGSQPLIQRAVGGRALDVVQASSGTFQEAFQKAKGEKLSDKEARKRGAEAVRQQYEKFSGSQIAMTGESRDVKAQAVLATNEKQLQENMRALSAAVGTELLPVLTRLIPEIAKLAEPAVSVAKAFTSLVSHFAENPLLGLGELIGAAFTIELAKASIGSLLSNAVNAFIRGALPGAAAPAASVAATPASAAASKVGALLTGAATNVVPTATSTAASTAGTIAGGAAATGLGMAGLAVGGLAAMRVGAENERNIIETRGGEIATQFQERLAVGDESLWGTAVAEESALSEVTQLRKTTGGGVGGGADITAIKAAISDIATAKMTGGTVQEKQDTALIEVMRDLTAAIQGANTMGAPGVNLNTSNVPTKPAVK